jgi:hypothetical protein
MAGVMFGNHPVLKFAPQKIADVTALYSELVLASRATYEIIPSFTGSAVGFG